MSIDCPFCGKTTKKSINCGERATFRSPDSLPELVLLIFKTEQTQHINISVL